MYSKPRMLAFPLAIVAGAALAASPQDIHLRSPDLQNVPRARLSHLLVQANANAPAVSDSGVGDADSFGRDVVYAGLLASSQVDMRADCSVGAYPGEICVNLSPQPAATSFDFEDMNDITLPGNSTHSFLCFHTTTYRGWQYSNSLGTPATAQFQYAESVTLESDLLNDPSLIDPTTGLPFNGKIRAYIGTDLLDSKTVQAGFSESHHEWGSRTCQDGVISTSSLATDYNLPQSIVSKFFKHPITLRLNLEGNAALVTEGQIVTGIRFYGD